MDCIKINFESYSLAPGALHVWQDPARQSSRTSRVSVPTAGLNIPREHAQQTTPRIPRRPHQASKKRRSLDRSHPSRVRNPAQARESQCSRAISHLTARVCTYPLAIDRITAGHGQITEGHGQGPNPQNCRPALVRSEERRVGEECRSRGAPGLLKKKKK